MKILHISLGLPPYRTGGLTKYSLDLMKVQVRKHDDVYLLYPGRHGLFSSAVDIAYNGKRYGIRVYEILNPLPVPLISGIAEPARFYKSTGTGCFQKFLNEVKPDIIHIHTIMGIHSEFFEAARENGIKMVFTTHDYFGLCPKANLLDFNRDFCSDTLHGAKCAICNRGGYSIKKIWMMQSGPYRLIKCSRLFSLVKFLDAKLRDRRAAAFGRSYGKARKTAGTLTGQVTAACADANSPQACEYVKLREYYFKIYRMIDGFHFNSAVSREVYGQFLHARGKVISITHADIKDNRIKRSYRNTEDLNIVYIGSDNPMKGFPMLKECLGRLLKEGVDRWHLTSYGCGRDESTAHYTFFQRYQYGDLKEIFGSAHVIVIPSIWKETFGFIGLEALSFGVPIVLSENVGFKDLLENGVTGLFYNGSGQELYKVMKSIIQDRGILRNIHTNIMNMSFSHHLYDHYYKMKNFYCDTLMEDL